VLKLPIVNRFDEWYFNLVNQVIPAEVETAPGEKETLKSFMKLRTVDTSIPS
jgi:hypothetical protein